MLESVLKQVESPARRDTKALSKALGMTAMWIRPDKALEETQMADPSEHEPHGTHQSKKAAASGWIGSALEYYDFFIYATAASLIFPQIFFPSGNPTVAIVASLATYGVGYV